MKKMKSMILCTGIKGVGSHDGELMIKILPDRGPVPEFHLPTTVVSEGNVILIRHGGELYAHSHGVLGFKPFSYTVSHNMSQHIRDLMTCLSRLGVITEEQLNTRLSELKAEADKADRAERLCKIVDDLKHFGVELTARQKKKIADKLNSWKSAL